MAASAFVTTVSSEPDAPIDATWVFLPDYLARLSTDGGSSDVLTTDQRRALLSGEFRTQSDLTTGVYRPTDPDPVLQISQHKFGTRDHYCAC